ncbi:MAG: histidine kinase [Anaerolineae bacterium]
MGEMPLDDGITQAQDQTEAQDAIELPRNVLRALLDTMPVGVIVSDAKGRVLMNNAISREILGGVVTGDVEHLHRPYTIHNPDGTPFPPEEVPLHRAIVYGEVSQDVEILIRRVDGTERTILTAAAPVHDETGRIANGIVVFQDITQRRARDQQTAVATERSHLAHELHDAVSQLLFSASVIAESLPRLWERNPERVRQGLGQLHQLTRGALAEMRTLLLELRPTALTEAALGDLLQQLVDAVRGQTRLRVALTVEGERNLPADVQITLYRIAQEALNNVIKHARATHVTVSLVNGVNTVTVRVADDGRGFDPNAVLPDHMGIGIMRERAESVGISLDVHSQAGHGTEIIATWPISDEEGNR